MKEFLVDLLGRDHVLDDPASLAPYREDFTEIEGADPDMVAMVETAEQVEAIVRRAGRDRVPLIPCVYRTNVGGLALAENGGVILDMTRMNRIIEVNADDMFAVIEPGVTQRQLKEHLTDNEPSLTTGYSLAPPDTSVFANALLGGLSNRSLKYGNQSDCISGLEVVLSDGSVVRTGSWAVRGVSPFARMPLPDLTGLFVAWQGTTGIVTRMAYQLWPLHPIRRRLFYLTYGTGPTYEAMRRLCRMEVAEDVGGLSWPTARMILGVKNPHPVPSEGEPTFFFYVELAAEIPEEIRAKEKILHTVIHSLRRDGETFDGPLEAETLTRIEPELGRFAEFPTNLDFLTDHGGGGLTWIGTYGPLSRFHEGADAGMAIMTRHGFPPTVVSRPMRGGHFGVLRFVTIFDKENSDEVGRVRALNRELLHTLTDMGFMMYKTPVWAWRELRSRIDPNMLALMSRLKNLLDPVRVFNPGKMEL